MSRNPYIQAAEELRGNAGQWRVYESDGNCVVQAMAQRRQYQPALALKSKLTGAVEFPLFVWVTHFCIQVNLRDFQGFVAKPTSNFHQVEAAAEPIRRRRLAKTVQVMLGADWARLARHVEFMSIVVSAFSNLRLTLPAIQPGALRNRFEFAEEVPLGLSVYVGEDPSLGHRVLLVVGQERTQFGRHRNMSLLVVLGKEGNIGFAVAAHCEAEPF